MKNYIAERIEAMAKKRGLISSHFDDVKKELESATGLHCDSINDYLRNPERLPNKVNKSLIDGFFESHGIKIEVSISA